MYQRLIFHSQLSTLLYRFVAVIKHVGVRRGAQCKLGLRARLPLRKTPVRSLNVTIRHLKWRLFGCLHGGNTGIVFAPGREKRLAGCATQSKLIVPSRLMVSSNCGTLVWYSHAKLAHELAQCCNSRPRILLCCMTLVTVTSLTRCVHDPLDGYLLQLAIAKSPASEQMTEKPSCRSENTAASDLTDQLKIVLQSKSWQQWETLHRWRRVDNSDDARLINLMTWTRTRTRCYVYKVRIKAGKSLSILQILLIRRERERERETKSRLAEVHERR